MSEILAETIPAGMEVMVCEKLILLVGKLAASRHCRAEFYGEPQT